MSTEFKSKYSPYTVEWADDYEIWSKARIAELEVENAKLKELISETLSNMEYYPASLGEMWLVQDSDITAMQAAALVKT